MAVKKVISEEVMTVLRAGKIEGNVFFLPSGQLDRKLYESVNKVLTNAGGKWDRKSRGHVFPSNPSEKLGLAISSGVSVNEKQLYQEYFTPTELAARLVGMADVKGHEVLEPSAGDGRLADACKASGAKSVTCVELQEKNIDFLEEKGYEPYMADFLTVTPLGIGRYNRIVMNPPFTKGQDVKHVLHAMKFLKPGGILVAIVAGGKNVPDELSDLGGCKISTEPVEDGAFKREGTGVKTMIVKIEKD